MHFEGQCKAVQCSLCEMRRRRRRRRRKRRRRLANMGILTLAPNMVRTRILLTSVHSALILVQ